MSDRKVVKEGVEAVLAKIDEIEASVSNFNGDNESLHTKLNEYVASLKTLHTASADIHNSTGQPLEVPVELLKYIDDGGNPDIFIEDVFRSSVAANQAAKVKVEAFKDFTDAFEKTLQQTMPDIVKQYRAMRELPSLDFPSVSEQPPQQQQ